MSRALAVDFPLVVDGAQVLALLLAPDGRYYVTRENAPTVLLPRWELEREGGPALAALLGP